MNTPKVLIPALHPAPTRCSGLHQAGGPEVEDIFRALRISDQLSLLEIFTAVMENKAAIQHAAHPLPIEALSLLVILEDRKSCLRALEKLRQEIRTIRGELEAQKAIRESGS